MIDAEAVIVEELERLAPFGGYEGSDWDEVLRRSALTRPKEQTRALTSRRRAGLLLIALAVLAGVLLVASAFGAVPRFLNFWQTNHASKAVIHSFSGFNRAPLPQWNQHVISNETRLVTTYHLRNGTPYPLYVAPRRGGGFCHLFKNGGGCVSAGGSHNVDHRGDHHASLIDLGVEGASSHHILDGDVTDRQIVSLSVEFRGGKEASVPILWIGEPINVGFFFYEVPRGAWDSVVAVIGKDAAGHEIARDQSELTAFHTPPPDWLTPSKVADLSKKHVILRDGPLSLSIAPSSAGGNCMWLQAGFQIEQRSCEPPQLLRQQTNAQLGQGSLTNHGPDYAAYFGSVKADVARLDLHFQDGTTMTLEPVDGYVLYDIPKSHWSPGHRLDLVVAYSSDGRTLQRQGMHPEIKYFYGCALPTQCRN